MKYTLYAVFAALFMFACNNTTQTSSAATTKDSIPQQDFFPVSEYIGGQLRIIIDSFRFPLTKTITINDKRQLTSATDEELRQLAQNFRQPDISDPAIRKFYKETNIADAGAGSVTLDYSTTNSSLPVQKVNVYIKADPVENDRVTGVYMEKAFIRGDTSFSQKLYWKTGKNMQVVTEKKVKDKFLPVEQVKITWDPSSE
ncbi:MAG: hypothetical protein ABIQ88_01085 [Chitinophagaceae bacterium]